MIHGPELRLLQQLLAEMKELREQFTKTQAQKSLPTFLSMQEAAAELSVSERQLRRLVVNGQVLPVRVGKAPKIPTSELRRIATILPTSQRNEQGRPIKKAPFPKAGYCSPEHERRRLVDLRKKRR